MDRPPGSWAALPDAVERPRSVSDAMVETLIAWGIDTVFGMVGHSNLGFAEALRRAEQRGQLRYIGIRHEGAAVDCLVMQSFDCATRQHDSDRRRLAGPTMPNSPPEVHHLRSRY
jgi:hypothetical protein